MSLIFQALSKLGSDAHGARMQDPSLPHEQTESSGRAARPVFWWTLALVLGLATVQLALQQDLPARVRLAFTEPGEWKQRYDSVVGVKNELVERAAHAAGAIVATVRSASESMAAVNGTTIAEIGARSSSRVDDPVAPQLVGAGAETGRGINGKNHTYGTVPVALPGAQKTGLYPAVVRTQTLGRLDTASGTPDSKTANQGPVPDHLPPQAGAGSARAGIETAAVYSLGPGPLPGSNDFSRDIVRPQDKVQTLAPVLNRRMFTDRRALKIESREEQQDRSRAKRVHISRLATGLTAAVEAGDQAETKRLLNSLSFATGAESNYALNMRAYVALANEQYADVEALLGRVLERDQGDANAGLNMAVAESRTGRLKQARERLEQLAIAHPDDERVTAMIRSLPAR